MGSTSLLLLGDFNVVRYASERMGGDIGWPPYMEELNDCCVESNRVDVGFSGHLLTWSMGSGD